MNKIKSTMLTVLCAGSLSFTQRLQAEESKNASSEHSHDHTASVNNPPQTEMTQSYAVALSAMHIHLDSINTELGLGKLGRIHAHVEAMNAALKNLENDPSLDEIKKKRVQGYVNNIGKYADSMHDAADEKKTAEAQKWAKKVSVQAELLEKQFSHPLIKK